jgi:hypothetical protein
LFFFPKGCLRCGPLLSKTCLDLKKDNGRSTDKMAF